MSRRPVIRSSRRKTLKFGIRSKFLQSKWEFVRIKILAYNIDIVWVCRRLHSNIPNICNRFLLRAIYVFLCNNIYLHLEILCILWIDCHSTGPKVHVTHWPPSGYISRRLYS